ncbi:MAG: VOC family protein [Acidimicrobiia bacterium]|nr:VOC family protein [Acidimicrobiia bacterium]
MTSAQLHPKGVNHLAISTADMKAQLEFFCDVLGLPLKALYWMHGVEGTYHGFVELSPESYIAFVQHPENSPDIQWGVSHAGNPGAPVTVGAMQHVAFHVDDLDQLLAMRDRLRDRGVQVMGPIDHGFCQSMYFAGPEGLSLEIACGAGIDERAWIDPEVQGLCGISDEEVEAMKRPAPYERPSAAVPQPDFDPAKPNMHPAERYEKVMAVPDEEMWANASETTPPVQI